jgi:hypothetical protein
MELLVNQVIALMNEADGDIGHNGWRASFEKFPIVFKRLRCLASQLADVLGFLGVFVPLRQIAGAEVIAKIVESFFKTRPGDVGPLDFDFLGGCAGLAALEKVFSFLNAPPESFDQSCDSPLERNLWAKRNVMS